MVKFSNRARGKPTKRKSLKTKYKIERKVKQHKKKMRKEAKKYKTTGIKPKKNQENNRLPNSYPFKVDILQQFKSKRPQEQITQNQMLDQSEWGVTALENSFKYLPKDKDHLTKKYFTNIEKIWSHANLIIEVLDVRNVETCIDESFRNECLKRNIKILTVVTKIDTVTSKRLQKIRTKLQNLKNQFVQFTTQPRRKNACLEEFYSRIAKISGQECAKCVVVGKKLTGKHTLIKQVMKSVKFYNEDYATIANVKINDNMKIIDTPYRLNDTTGYPLFYMPSPLSEQSLAAQEQKILKQIFILKNQFQTLDRNELLVHYSIQDYSSLDDLLKKVGKANRMFGKGGMVDLHIVRETLLKDWYSSKLNRVFD